MYRSVDSLGMWNIQTFETNRHFYWMESWVSGEFEYSYKSLKSKFSLILFVYNLMIGCSKENGANYPKKYGGENGKMLASEASSSIGLGRGKEWRSFRHPLTSSDYRSARFARRLFFPRKPIFSSFSLVPGYTTTSLWVVFSLSTLYFKTADLSLTTGIKQWKRNVVLGWVSVCGEGRNTSSSENACASVLVQTLIIGQNRLGK